MISEVWVGATTDSSAVVSTKATGSSVRLLVGTDIELLSPTGFGPVSPVNDRVKIEATGLTPGTTYYFALEEDSVRDTVWTGKFRTHPVLGSQASFTIAVGSCAGLANGEADEVITAEVSNHPVFGVIRDFDPLMFWHLGDMHYRNIDTNDVALYRDAFSDTLTYNGSLNEAALQGLLYRNVSTAYMWDDHDFGPNNSDGSDPGREAARFTYREVVPHYPLSSPGAVYQAVQIGRVLFVLSDTRSERSPNETVDGASKTMLGVEQKEWFRGLLESTSAKFLMWMTPTPWWAYSGDSWEGFPTERREMLAMFVETGWDTRMAACFGDRHTMGIASGDVQPWGSFPLFLTSGLDSHTTEVPDGRYDRGALQARGGWMTLDINDVGEQISVTATIRVNSGAGRNYTYRINVPVDPEDGDTLPPVTEARRQTQVTWLACDLATGRIIDELPDITGSVSRVLGAYTSANLQTPIVSSGKASRRNILGSTSIADVMLCAVVNDIPTWAGTVLKRRTGSDSAVVELAVASIDGYLQRRFVRDLGPYEQVDASRIANAILGHAGAIEGVGSGIGLVRDIQDCGLLIDKTYLVTDRKTVYECLTELMDMEGGPEWTVDLAWTDARQNTIAKVAKVRPRIGIVAKNAVFESKAKAAVRYTYVEDFTEGHGSNYVIAYSSGQGDSQPASSPAVDTNALALGRPIYEHQYTPDTSISDVAILDAHARAELTRVQAGTRTFQFTSRWDVEPRLNLDWGLGDTVSWLVHGPAATGGLSGSGRVVGWDLDMQAGTVGLTIADEDINGQIRSAFFSG